MRCLLLRLRCDDRATTCNLVRFRVHNGRVQLKPNSSFEAGSKLVADRFEVGSSNQLEPASVMEFGFYAIWFQAVRSWSQTGSRWSQTGSKLVGDQLRTSFEPASVMEFGLTGHG